MVMIRILIPTDFSDNAFNAIRYALQLFKDQECTYYFMHAFQDEIYADKALLTQETLDEVTKIINERSTIQLEETLKEVTSTFPNSKHSFRIICENSRLLDETDKIVEDNDIDVIIMGTRGKTNDRKLSFGSHTLQVLKYVQCPVLAIPENYHYSEPKHLLFSTNYLIPYKSRELEFLHSIINAHQSITDLFYVTKLDKLSAREKNNRDHIIEKLGQEYVNAITAINNNIIDAIYEYISDNDIDMLVMVNTKHSFLENILFQSRIDRMSLHVDIPFLALQNMKRR